jgi:hypothetical protein
VSDSNGISHHVDDGFSMWSPWVGRSGLPPMPGQATFDGGAPMQQQAAPQLPGPGVPLPPHPLDLPASLVDSSGTTATPMLPLPPPPPGLAPSSPEAAPVNGFGANLVPENGHTLGLALLLVGVGSAIGVKYGGVFGGVAGAVYGGSTVNGIRAARAVVQGTPEADKEAMVSATYAVIGAGFATWLVWKSTQRKKAST